MNLAELRAEAECLDVKNIKVLENAILVCAMRRSFHARGSGRNGFDVEFLDW